MRKNCFMGYRLFQPAGLERVPSPKMVKMIQTTHAGNQVVHHGSEKKIAEALWNAKMPSRFTTRLIASPIKPVVNNVFLFFMVWRAGLFID